MVSQTGGAANGRMLEIICIAVVVVILSLGLWPFHVPGNNVSWLEKSNGIRLGRYSTVIGRAALPAGRNGSGVTLEVWLQAARPWTSGTFLSIVHPDGSSAFEMRQSLIDLRLERVSSQGRRSVSVDEVFHPKKPRYITVTSGASGAAIYIDGVPAKTVPHWRIPAAALAGTVILGDAPWQSDSWSGTLMGVAFYDEELTPGEVLKHFRGWTTEGRPEIRATDRCAALYLFRERSGTVIHSDAGSGGELSIPLLYMVLDQKLLEPFWQEFSMSREYWEAALKNVVGFLPVGFVFYAYLAGVRRLRRPVLLTVLLGFLISLTIEVTQWFLPMRDSGTSDLITNSLGTWIGVVLYRWLQPVLVGIFWWLPIFPQPRV
jgi:VanZ family protein